MSINPLSGVGFAGMAIVFFLNCYYNVIIAWILFYLFASLTNQLPWTHCNEWWNTPQCHLTGGNSSGANTSEQTISLSARGQSARLLNHTKNNGSLDNLTAMERGDWLVDPVSEFWE
ncbi:unnamed protein product [Protopolystoma xenopodis]|uniref:Uncharacterized protein n=1 Tax=Protopolystoma xenopodis TaxID=117903 RepID=A0A3S5CSV5_9PLAT|nr:unnamed protein product [Protopolystoma xenopodis]